MENKNQPAFPVLELKQLGDKMLLDCTGAGLSKREWMATMALQGPLANPDYNCPSRPKDIATTMNTAKAAIHYGDALIAELSKA